MNLQYISDDNGNKTSVIIPIEKWNKLLQDLFVKEVNEIPEWQIQEVNDRISELDKNPISAIDFDEMLLRVKQKYDL